jgi:hypothetical protein
MRLLTALGLTAALLFAGCGGAGTAPTITAPVTHVIKGSVKVFDFNVGYDPDRTVCIFLNPRYDDVDARATVTVKDGAGSIVGVSKLEAVISTTFDYCLFPFSVTVSDAEFYSIEVSRRGELNFSKADLESKGWLVQLKIGE